MRSQLLFALLATAACSSSAGSQGYRSVDHDGGAWEGSAGASAAGSGGTGAAGAPGTGGSSAAGAAGSGGASGAIGTGGAAGTVGSAGSAAGSSGAPPAEDAGQDASDAAPACTDPTWECTPEFCGSDPSGQASPCCLTECSCGWWFVNKGYCEPKS